VLIVQAPGRKAGDAAGGEVPIDENKFDEFNGVLEGGMLANMGEYDEDDKEADKVWAGVDDYMDERRRVGSSRSPRGSSKGSRGSIPPWLSPAVACARP
jgi:pre-mRNA-processing factor 6